MSNKTQLQQNNLEYDSLIELLSGKSIGSSISLQEKNITPTTSSQTVEPDSGYDGLSKVTVDAMPTAAQATPSITISSSGLITAKSMQLAGYVEGGTKTATNQLTTQAAKTITPSTSSQTAVASGVYTTGAITVGAIPSSYVKPTSTKGTTTYTPTTTNQTIASGTYCTGIQTIKGDANLIASNIKSGVSIFGVSGSYEGSGGGSGNNTITFPDGIYAIFDDTVLPARGPGTFAFTEDDGRIEFYEEDGTPGTISNLTISIDDTDVVTITYQYGEAPLLTAYNSNTGWAKDCYKTIKLYGYISIALLELLRDMATITETPKYDVSEEVAEYTDLNTELEEVINSLPSAGGGGNLETVKLTINYIGLSGPAMPGDDYINYILYYTDGSGNPCVDEYTDDSLFTKEYTVLKNSLIHFARKEWTHFSGMSNTMGLENEILIAAPQHTQPTTLQDNYKFNIGFITSDLIASITIGG